MLSGREDMQSMVEGFCLKSNVVGRPFGDSGSCLEFEIQKGEICAQRA